MARNLLETAGIRCMVEGGPMSVALGVELGAYASASEAQDLKVRAVDAEAALELLSDAFGDEDDGEAPYRKSDEAVDELEESFDEDSDDAQADRGR
jgi:hypothetical protein